MIRMLQFRPARGGYQSPMLYTILIVLAIIALVVYIFGRARR